MSKAIQIFIFCLFLIPKPSWSQNKQDSLKVLFVGNSYTYVSNIPHLVSLISEGTSTKIVTQKSTVGGARLREHWNGEKGLKTKELIKNGNFDIVVLQEQSMGTIEHSNEFLKYVSLFSDFIRKTGAQPYLYTTWAREKVPQYQKVITSLYQKAALENSINIVYVGEAWKLAKELRPSVELFSNDGSHQSPIGAFLTACVFVKTILKELPETIRNECQVIDAYGESVWLMNIDPLDVVFCKKIANEIVKE